MERAPVPSSSYGIERESSPANEQVCSIILFSVSVSPVLKWCCKIGRNRWEEGEGKVRITFRPLCPSLSHGIPSTWTSPSHPRVLWALAGAAVNSDTLWETCSLYLCVWWAVNGLSQRERERHHANRIPGTRFLCDSFPHECPLRGQARWEKRSNPAGFLYEICDEYRLAWRRHSIFTSTALRHFEFAFLYKKLYQEQEWKGDKEWGICAPPPASDNKAVFHAACGSQLQPRVSWGSGCRDSLFQSIMWPLAPTTHVNKSNSKGRCGRLSPEPFGSGHTTAFFFSSHSCSFVFISTWEPLSLRFSDSRAVELGAACLG